MGNYFQYKNSKFHYYIFGSGKKPLIAFHGFGQNGQMFAPLEVSLGKEFTIYSFDFAYHGKTIWNEAQPCTKDELIQVLKQLMMEHQYQKISLMGFSMGGRIAISMIADMAAILDDVFLIAPDGISERFYYRKIVANKFGAFTFKWMLKHPQVFISAMNVMSKIGLTKKYVATYAMNYLGERRRREKIYNIWRSMSTFRTDLAELNEAAEKFCPRIFLFWGKKDRILNVALAQKFKQRVPQATLNIVDGGHFIVHQELNHIISANLQQ